jgi:ABC transporter substrate binding protein
VRKSAFAVAIGGKADMALCTAYVRFRPKADIGLFGYTVAIPHQPRRLAMRRREFIILSSGAVAAWTLVAHAQQGERMRRIGVLLGATEDDTEFQVWVGAFRQALQELGWIDGRNVRIDTHWATIDAAGKRKHAEELAALAPDVIVAPGASTVGPLQQATRTVPIVFPIMADPVAAGFVDSLARPCGNATGFMLFEYSISGKWLELLKQIAPGVTRVAVLGDTNTPTGPRPVRRHSGGGAVTQGGGELAQQARRRRDRAQRHGLRAIPKWRSDRDRGRAGAA